VQLPESCRLDGHHRTVSDCDLRQTADAVSLVTITVLEAVADARISNQRWLREGRVFPAAIVFLASSDRPFRKLTAAGFVSATEYSRSRSNNFNQAVAD
jgi:hypothetical protein